MGTYIRNDKLNINEGTDLKWGFHVFDEVTLNKNVMHVINNNILF